jgi:hypothetical protein
VSPITGGGAGGTGVGDGDFLQDKMITNNMQKEALNNL